MSRGKGRPKVDVERVLRERDAAAAAKVLRWQADVKAQLDAKDRKIAALHAHIEGQVAKIAEQRQKLDQYAAEGADFVERQVRDLRRELDKRDRIIAELRSGLVA